MGWCGVFSLSPLFSLPPSLLLLHQFTHALMHRAARRAEGHTSSGATRSAGVARARAVACASRCARSPVLASRRARRTSCAITRMETNEGVSMPLRVSVGWTTITNTGAHDTKAHGHPAVGSWGQHTADKREHAMQAKAPAGVPHVVPK
jgi:hypothetical protein